MSNVIKMTNEIDVVLVSNYGAISELQRQSLLLDYGAKLQISKCDCDEYDCNTIVEKYTYTIDKNKCSHLHEKFEDMAKGNSDLLYMYTKSVNDSEYVEIVWLEYTLTVTYNIDKRGEYYV